jgi:hypothetical protein
VKLTFADVVSNGFDFSTTAYAGHYTIPEGVFTNGDYFVPRNLGDGVCAYRKSVINYGTALSRTVDSVAGTVGTGCRRTITYRVEYQGGRTIIQIYLNGAVTAPTGVDYHYVFFADSAIAPGTVNLDGSVTFDNLIEDPSTVFPGGPINGENYFYGGTITIACAAAEDVVADAGGTTDDECVIDDPGDYTCESCGTYSFATNSTASIGYDFNDDSTSRNWSGAFDLDFQSIYSLDGNTYVRFATWAGTTLPTGPYAEAVFDCTNNLWAVNLYLESGVYTMDIGFTEKSGTASGATWTQSDGNYDAENNDGTVTVTGSIGITVGNACET